MLQALFRFFLLLFCSLPNFALAATNYSINAGWAVYSAPNGATLIGLNLYRDGVLACQTQVHSPPLWITSCTFLPTSPIAL